MIKQGEAVYPYSALGVKLVGALFKYQWRTKRTITFWVARKAPLYFKDRWRGCGRDLLFHREEPIYSKWLAERDYWIKQLNAIDGVEVIAVYPAWQHLHITVKLLGIDCELNPSSPYPALGDRNDCPTLIKDPDLTVVWEYPEDE